MKRQRPIAANTRGPFWSICPARILWVAVLGTQIVVTLIAPAAY
ncbi:MAG TPA: hypothetical protein VND64_19170 [Pirellulales bacterium]|nr:hypothetical protein [Pirellulales bacterium]